MSSEHEIPAVAYLGPPGTYSEQALLEYAPAAEGIPFGTEREAIVAVADGTVQSAIVPIENSIEGGVRGTLDALAGEDLGVAIVAEADLPVELCLIGRPVSLDQVERVISHPQPLAQASRFLATDLPGAAQIAARSTADAAKQVSESEGASLAIGSRRAAELYGLDVLAESIQDEDGNVTRFVVVSPKPIDTSGAGPWKTTLVFYGAGDDHPGWLVRCLAEFGDRDINLVKIESRPRRGQLGHYLFVADLEGAVSEPTVAAAVQGLGDLCEVVRVLGSYRPADNGG